MTDDKYDRRLNNVIK